MNRSLIYTFMTKIKQEWEGRDYTGLDISNEIERRIENEVLKGRWGLGFRDRGMGHGDYAVVVDDGINRNPEDLSEKELMEYLNNPPAPPLVVVECETRELAEHIVDLHNGSLA